MRWFPISRFKIYGHSMLPSLQPGQEILCFNWAYIFSKPQKGHLVVIRFNRRVMIKRVQKVYDREYFVQGDNLKRSTDSRSFGPLSKKNIIGKVVWVVR